MSSITGSRCLIAYRSCPFWPYRRCEKCPAKISTKTVHVTQPACSKFRENYNELVATLSASRGTGLIAQLAEKECRPEAELRSAGADEASAPARAFAIQT